MCHWCIYNLFEIIFEVDFINFFRTTEFDSNPIPKPTKVNTTHNPGLDLGCVDFDFSCSTPLPISAWADGKLAEQVGKMVEHH